MSLKLYKGILETSKMKEGRTSAEEGGGGGVTNSLTTPKTLIKIEFVIFRVDPQAKNFYYFIFNKFKKKKKGEKKANETKPFS